MNKKQFSDFLITGLKEMQLDYNQQIVNMLWEYMNFLVKENKLYNLTAIESEEDIINKHFFDSLVFFQYYNPDDKDKIIDVGTGAGFPGMVLKIYRPELNIWLIDSLNKRIKFLNKLIELLNIKGVETIHVRAEEIGTNQDFREKFTYVLSRAVAPINILSEYTIPLAIKNGTIVLFKGPSYQEELKEGDKAISILGGKLNKKHNIKVPNLKGERFFLEIKKIQKTPKKYPRRPGFPKKHPL